MKVRGTALVAVLLAGTAMAEPVTLTPADPQPDQDSLTPGLAVSYSYTGNVRTLEDAGHALADAEPGPPLPGLSYLDTDPGEMTMTSTSETKVSAAITGFIRFESSGLYTLDVWSNDGIAMTIGGQEIANFDETHPCESAGIREVDVPEAGWYALEATYFQRKGSSCLLMDWGMGGEMEPVPDTVFAHSQ